MPEAPASTSNDSSAPGWVRHELVCLDRSPLSERIVPHAVAIARVFGARVTLLHVLEPARPRDSALQPTDALDWEMRRQEAYRYLGREAEAHGKRGLAVQAQLVEGEAPGEIQEWGAHHDVDLTALCSHGASGYTQWALASTAQKLIEGVSGSLLLIPALSCQETAKAIPYRRILVPLDCSLRPESAVHLAACIAREHDAEVILAHVVPPVELTGDGPPEAGDVELERRLLAEVTRRLRAQELRVGVIIAGGADVRGELGALVAREHADLVVLTSHGHTGCTERSLGSVAHHVVEHSNAPLLIVREGRGAERHRGPRPPPTVQRGRPPSLAERGTIWPGL
jgi:nucleotide-binding universal stress UspA family protein